MIFQTRLWAAALIIAVVLIGGFVLSVPRAREVHEAKQGLGGTATSTTPVVALRDSYKKSVHTLSGFVMAPDACASVSASTTLAAVLTASTSAMSTGKTSRIFLDLVLTESAGVCLEVPTGITFSTTVAAPANTPIDVHVNGALASTTRS